MLIARFVTNQRGCVRAGPKPYPQPGYTACPAISSHPRAKARDLAEDSMGLAEALDAAREAAAERSEVRGTCHGQERFHEHTRPHVP